MSFFVKMFFRVSPPSRNLEVRADCRMRFLLIIDRAAVEIKDITAASRADIRYEQLSRLGAF